MDAIDTCKHKWVKFNGPAYPRMILGFMTLCDELHGCEICGAVKAKCTTPLECEDGDFYWPGVIMSGEHYIRQIHNMGSEWAEWSKP
ncbi:hypothetical protein, partial [Streptomyces galilaeus]|uniref:hypothetical protein n=1 Tax=Streptomyces galilaeus TaxID=33899 RepID=UPI0038F79380